MLVGAKLGRAFMLFCRALPPLYLFRRVRWSSLQHTGHGARCILRKTWTTWLRKHCLSCGTAILTKPLESQARAPLLQVCRSSTLPTRRLRTLDSLIWRSVTLSLICWRLVPCSRPAVLPRHDKRLLCRFRLSFCVRSRVLNLPRVQTALLDDAAVVQLNPRCVPSPSVPARLPLDVCIPALARAELDWGDVEAQASQDLPSLVVLPVLAALPACTALPAEMVAQRAVLRTAATWLQLGVCAAPMVSSI